MGKGREGKGREGEERGRKRRGEDKGWEETQRESEGREEGKGRGPEFENPPPHIRWLLSGLQGTRLGSRRP